MRIDRHNVNECCMFEGWKQCSTWSGRCLAVVGLSYGRRLCHGKSCRVSGQQLFSSHSLSTHFLSLSLSGSSFVSTSYFLSFCSSFFRELFVRAQYADDGFALYMHCKQAAQSITVSRLISSSMSPSCYTFIVILYYCKNCHWITAA